MTTEDELTADTVEGGARIGELLAGKYRLERLLGRGGMGEVYEARHVVVGRRFAVKFPRGQASSSAGARFLREARAAGALESPHLAAVLDYDRAADGAPFLVMELLEGESLARVLRRERRLPLPRVLNLLAQACAGLAVAHAAGIVHRDLKPENLWLVRRSDGEDQLKIMDFGIAKLLGEAPGTDVTQSGAVLGTPFYMAPEQARGARDVDARVDVHALGVIAYELLSGTKPHPGESYNAILAHILTEPVEPLGRLCPELPKALVAVIERAMAFDPAARHASAQALSNDLSRFARPRSAPHDVVDLAAPSHSRAVAASDALGVATDDSPGTLQTAVGDARTPPAPRSRAGWVLLFAAVATGIWAIAARSPRDAASVAAPSASSLAPPLPASSPAPAGSTLASRAPETPAAPTVSATVASGTLSAKRPAPARAARPPTVASSLPPPAAPVTFDEKNPY